MTHFFCCSVLLAPGSVVEPGNWGRIISLYTPAISATGWTLARELIFERVRLQHYAEKPSRFGAIFLCLTEREIQEFKSATARHVDLSYEVELVDPAAASHVADWSIIDTRPNDRLADFERRAHSYWQAENIEKRELVTLSPIRVIKRCRNDTFEM